MGPPLPLISRRATSPAAGSAPWAPAGEEGSLLSGGGLLTSGSRLPLSAREMGISGQKKAIAVQPIEQTTPKAFPYWFNPACFPAHLARGLFTKLQRDFASPQ